MGLLTTVDKGQYAINRTLSLWQCMMRNLGPFRPEDNQ